MGEDSAGSSLLRKGPLGWPLFCSGTSPSLLTFSPVPMWVWSRKERWVRGGQVFLASRKRQGPGKCLLKKLHF